MLAGSPNPNDIPKRNDIAKTSNVFEGSTSIKKSEDTIPNVIQTMRNVVLLLDLSVIIDPTIAKKVAVMKCAVHISVDVSFMMVFNTLNAIEYHIKVLDIKTIFASSAFNDIPNLFFNI
jgi:hypothetical protein